MRRSASDDLDDRLAVEAAVLDEDRPVIDAGGRAAGDEQAGDVGFECHGIVYRCRSLVEHDAGPCQEVVVGAVAGEQIYIVSRQLLVRAARLTAVAKAMAVR